MTQQTPSEHHDFAGILAEIEQRQARDSERGRALAAVLRPVLREAGIDRIRMAFDGSGDEGWVNPDDILADPAASWLTMAPQAIEDLIREPARELLESLGVRTWDGKARHLTCADVAAEAGYALLEAKHPGWEINEGAFGEIQITVSTWTARLEFNQRSATYESSDVDLEL